MQIGFPEFTLLLGLAVYGILLWLAWKFYRALARIGEEPGEIKTVQRLRLPPPERPDERAAQSILPDRLGSLGPQSPEVLIEKLQAFVAEPAAYLNLVAILQILEIVRSRRRPAGQSRAVRITRLGKLHPSGIHGVRQSPIGFVISRRSDGQTWRIREEGFRRIAEDVAHFGTMDRARRT